MIECGEWNLHSAIREADSQLACAIRSPQFSWCALHTEPFLAVARCCRCDASSSQELIQPNSSEISSAAEPLSWPTENVGPRERPCMQSRVRAASVRDDRKNDSVQAAGTDYLQSEEGAASACE